ncbi:MAG: hypothetical protein P8X74_15690 [Reinekea sp.]
MSDQQERTPRDFHDRDPEEQAAFLENTWCNHCQEVDLGMVDPIEYEFLGRIFIEGKCARCGEITVTEVDESDEDDE